MSREQETRSAYERPSVVALGSVAARTGVIIDKGSVVTEPSDLVLKEDVSSLPGAVDRLRRLSSR
jgi:hypothetical protein